MRDFFETHRERLSAIRTFPFDNREAYIEFLAQTRHYVVHTTRLLGLTASRVGPEREKLHFRFLRAASDERSHHLLAEHDIAALGGTLDDHPELPITAALYQTQYFQVEHTHPTSVFGYILALEGLASLHGDWVHETIQAAHGTGAARFVKLHANEDPEHVEKAFQAIDPLCDDEKRLVKKNFLHTCDLYDVFLKVVGEASR